METILTISLVIAIVITVNRDFNSLYDSISNFLFGGKKLTPKEL